ncbi:hypothetical protein MMPV_008615 [Pyropia vietnamensis]
MRAPRCRCGRDADADGRHFLSACPEQSSGHVRLHHHIVHLVVEALRRTPSWGAVEAEAVVERGRGALRPDLRATHASSGAVVWADASVTAPFGPRTTAPTAASPLRAVAAEARERAKVAKYANALPGPPASHTFTPLVWEAYGRIGPATAKWLRGAMRGPALSGPDRARMLLLERAVVAVLDASGVAATTEARVGVLTAICADLRAPIGSESGVPANRGPDSALSAEMAAPIAFFAPSSAPRAPFPFPPAPTFPLPAPLGAEAGASRAEAATTGECAAGSGCGVPGGRAATAPLAAPSDPSLVALPAGRAAAAEGATGGWAEVVRRGRRRRGRGPSSPISSDGPGGATTTALQHRGGTGSGGGGVPPCAVVAGGADAMAAAGGGAACGRAGGAVGGGEAAWGSSVGGHVGPLTPMADPPAGPRRAADGDFRGPPLATADARAAAAAAELRRVRRRPADAPTLATVYVAGVSRDVRQHRMRALLADVTGVDVHSIVDVDRFGATTAVTVVAAAAEGFRSAVGKGRAATVLRLLPTADPWAPALLGAARRRGLSAAAAAAAAAGFCRRRLEAKLAQLPARAAMPPHLRAALHAHIQGMLSSHAGGGPAPASPSGSAAHRSPPPPASEAARMPPAERATGAAATMPSAPTPTGGAPAPGPTTAAPDGPASPARGDAMADATGAAVARPFAPGRGADRLGRRSAAAKAAVPAQAASPSAASPPHRRSWVRRRPPAAASLARGVEAAARLPPLPPPPSPPPPGAARAAAFAASVALPLVAAARKRAAAARSRSPAPRARTTRRQVRLALAVARLGAAPASPARLAGRRTRGAAAAARVAAASPPPTPRAPKRARLRPPPTSPPPALGAATPAEARRPAPPPPPPPSLGTMSQGWRPTPAPRVTMSDLRGAEGGWAQARCLRLLRLLLAASAADAADSTAASAATTTADGGEPGPPSACPVAGCRVLLRGDIADRGGLAHLSLAHVIGEVPAEVATALGLGGCRWCGRPYRSQRGPRGRSSLSAHEALCRLNPRRQRARWRCAHCCCGGGGTALFFADPPAWAAARAAFLRRVAPAGADWAPLVASGARTAAHVPAALLRAWRVLATDSLDWVRREPEQQHAWLWLLLLPSLLLHTPSTAPAGAPDAPRPPLPLPARAGAVLNGEFSTALADRNAGVWRPSWRRCLHGRRRETRPAALAAKGMAPSQRRALRLVRAGRLSAAARTLLADEPAPHTASVWRKATSLFPPATSASASAASVEAEFADLLADAAEFGDGATVPRGVTREAVREAIRRAPRAAAPGPSGLRPEHLWALEAGGQDALVGVLELLVSTTAVTRVPAMAAHALAGADLLLLAKPGGRGAQQGDPLGPLLHAAALWLVLRRLQDRHPGVLVRAFHDDVVAAGTPGELAAVMGDAAAVGASVDAELAPTKCTAARLAAAVDADAKAALGGMLCDARDSTATREAVLERAALPPAMGGLGVGGRTRVVPAALLASWVDALRAGQAYSPALRATADGLLAVPRVAADGGPLPPVVAAPAAWPSSCGPRPPHEGRQGASAPPAVSAVRPAGAPPRSGGPPPPSAPDRGAPAAAALRQALLSLLAAHAAHCAAPPSGLLWSMARGGPNSAADEAADALAPPPPPLPHPEYGAGATTSTSADGPHSPAPHSPPTWQSLLGGEAPAAQRDLSRPAHAAARARIYAELSGWRRAGMAACQGCGAARWLSALPTPGTAGTAIPGAGMRVAVRLWLGVPPRSVPPAPRCRCGRDADADGRHFLSACPEQSSGHVRLHHHIVHLVVEALRRTPSWGAVEAEAVVERGRGALRPDLRATHASSGAVVWADASVTAPFGPRTTAPTAASPLRAVAAEARERAKVAKYANALPGPPASHTFTPLVWEAYGRIGPATAKWLRGAMRGPALSGVRSTLLTPAAAEGATGGWAEVVRRGRRRRGRGPLSPISDGPGGATTTALQHRGGTGSGGGGAQPCAVAASGAGVVAAAGGGAASGCAGGAVGGGEAAWASSVGGHGGPPTPMADPPAGPRRAADGDFRGTPLATADARAAAAAAELRRVRRRPADAPTLATVYVAGVSRDVRQHRMRTLLADVTGVDVHSIVDVDRFGATTAVTVVAAAAEGFRAAVGKGRAATVLRLLPTADPWAPALLGAARRRGLSAEAAAAAAAGFCRRRLEGKLAQLPARAAMPPHLRAALHAHIKGMLSSHAGGGTAPASPSGSAAHRSLPPPASAAARMLPAERATGAAATMPSAPTPTSEEPAPGPPAAAPDGPASPERGDAMADVMGAAVARPFAPGRGADRLGPRSAAALAAVPAKAASPSAASTPRRRSWVRRRPPAAAPPPRAAEAAERLPPLPPPPSPPPPGAARAAAFAASVALPLVAAARKRAAAARSRSPAPRARTTRRQVRLALAVARLGAAPASPARLAGRRTRGAAAAARVAAASPPPTPRAPKRARLRPPPTSPQPALGAATPAEARRPAPPPPCAAIPGHDEPGMAAHASAEADAADSTAASAATPTAEGGEPGPPSACPVAGCRVLLRGDIANRGGLAHLSLAHVIGEVPAEVATALGLGGCRWCGRPYRSQRGPRGRSSLSAHEALCRLNPRRQRARAAPVAAPSADGWRCAHCCCGGGGTALFFADPPAWAAARAAFLRRVAPAGADWAPLVASGARTAAHVPAALLRAWRVLATDSLDWVRREPEQQHAWLWLLLLPSLLLHTPSTAPAGAPDAPRPPLLLPARAEAVLNGEFSTALADRNAGVWRPSWRRCLDGWRRETRPAALAAKGLAPSQRRALRLVRAGRLSAAARTLLADEPAPHTAAVWRKATSLFPPATSASASAASVEAEFADLLADAAEFGDGATVPRGVTREALLVSAAAVTRVPAAAAHALAGADLLLLAKPGGVGGDGLPGLRPIGMPETLRKLAASALAATVRKAAAAFLAPAQLGVGVPSACERLVHELDAHLAHHPQHAVVQLDYRNAFNLVSRPAAAAVLRRALPPLAPYLEWVYGGGEAPTVYGWAAGGEGADGDAAPGGGAGDANGGDDGEGADGGDDDGVDGENGGGGGDGGDDDGGDDGGGGRDAATGGARGAQQGDPLGPLLHAAALWLVLRRLQDRHPGVLVRAFHDDVVAAGTPGELAAVMADAAAAGASVDAELAPTKCTGWVGGKWAAEGVVQFSVPLGGHAFVAAGVDRLVADQRRLVAAIAALPPEELQSQLLLLRLCAGPRANYWLRCLPLEAAARLAAAVDADAKAALGGMLCDARDSTATRAAVLERAALPPAMGGLGVGGRTRVVPAALLASWVDALRAGQAYSPALRATADGLLAVPRVAADGGPLPPVAVAPAAPPPDCGPWLSHEGRQGASAPPAVRSARSAGAPPRSGGPPPPSTPDRRAPAAAALRQALLSLLAAHAAHCAAPPPACYGRWHGGAEFGRRRGG